MPTLPDSAEFSQNINHSFYVLISKFKSLPDSGNYNVVAYFIECSSKYLPDCWTTF